VTDGLFGFTALGMSRAPLVGATALWLLPAPGTELAAVPVGLLSIDPCLSCTER
jgi:hypothetical protein